MLPGAGFRARSILPFEFDGQGRRRSSLQEAADAILWETFRGPGPTDQVMLPPQPSRDESSTKRKVSFGQPLQLIDSNVVLPYQGKGKGRARDFDPAQQFAAWEEANIGGAGGFDLAEPGNDFVPPQQLSDPPSQFTFVPGQLETLQPTNTTRTRPHRGMNIQSQDSQVRRSQTLPSANRRRSSAMQPQIPRVPLTRLLPSIDPPTVPIAQLKQAPATQLHSQAQLPLQQAFQPPPGFPQQPASPGRNFYPGTELQQSHVETAQPPLQKVFQPPPGFPQRATSPSQTFYPGRELRQSHVEATQLPLQQAFQVPPSFLQQPIPSGQTFDPGIELHQPNVETNQPTNIQPLPPVEIPMRSGYHFQPGRGFICNVCSACVIQPGIHRFQGQNFWCYADGPEMRLNDEVNVQRWPKRAKMDLYVP